MNAFALKTQVLVLAAASAVAFGIAVDRADAAYTAKVSQGTLSIAGDAASDKLALRLKAGSSNILQVDVGANGSANFNFDRSTFDKIAVHAGGGDDVVRIAEGNGAFTDTEKTTILGEGGADTLVGGSFGETLGGGDGADNIDGNACNDAITLGPANDVDVWNAGDGTDTVGAGDGLDRVRVNGSDESEIFNLRKDIGLLRIVRSTGSGTGESVGVNGAELVELHAFRGSDTISIGDLTGTGATGVDVDLSASGGANDAEFDNVLLGGVSGADNKAQVSAFSGVVKVTGLVPTLSVSHSDPALDLLDVAGFSGNDTFKAGDGIGALIEVGLHGNQGDDVLIGGDGPETLDAGDGGDFLQGKPGDDVLFAGAGNDFVDGGLGSDHLDCGLGGSIDTVISDPSDSVAPDCF
jgi:RTX calcium-binding nonapeptide repeat (4 copies)